MHMHFTVNNYFVRLIRFLLFSIISLQIRRRIHRNRFDVSRRRIQMIRDHPFTIRLVWIWNPSRSSTWTDRGCTRRPAIKSVIHWLTKVSCIQIKMIASIALFYKSHFYFSNVLKCGEFMTKINYTENFMKH